MKRKNIFTTPGAISCSCSCSCCHFRTQQSLQKKLHNLFLYFQLNCSRLIFNSRNKVASKKNPETNFQSIFFSGKLKHYILAKLEIFNFDSVTLFWLDILKNKTSF